MDTATLRQILLAEMECYTGEGLNDRAYLTVNETDGVYTIVDIARVQGRRLVGTVLVARLDKDRVVIELDRHDKPLVDALIMRGVPKAQIVLAYHRDALPA
ncbi:MAG: element excision factor XisI family protein [Chloroflexota bacterium]|nr:element excision factor XisI family protein [Chloroflexota bacterium]MDE2858795.1 element excision factor XisI family protein [Chloroflexota bacterium]MDE2951155.1 element excision factor XisI family protein [Chloroflexota bacterium]